MTLNEMQNLIYSNLDDNLKSLFTTNELRLKINAAMRYLWNELNKRGVYLNTTTETVSFVSGSQEITISGSVSKILYAKDSENLHVPIYSEEQSIKSDRRSCYLQRGITVSGTKRNRTEKLGWYREPDTAFDIVIKYNQQIETFAESASGEENYQDIPEEHHNVIVLYATMLCNSKYEEPNQQWEKLFGIEFDNMVDVLSLENVRDQEVVDVTYA